MSLIVLGLEKNVPSANVFKVERAPLPADEAFFLPLVAEALVDLVAAFFFFRLGF